MNNQFDKGGTTAMAASVQTPRQNTTALRPPTNSVTWAATKRKLITSIIGRYNQTLKTTNINHELTYRSHQQKHRQMTNNHT